MSKYEDLFKKIIKVSKDGEISWEQASESDKYFTNKETITKSFQSEYKGVRLLWIEAKSLEYNPDFDRFYEEFNHYLVLIKDGVAARYISGANIDKNMLYEMDDVLTNLVTKIDDSIDLIIKE